MFILLRDIDFVGRRVVLQLDGTMSVDTVAQLGQYLRYCLDHGYQDVELSHPAAASPDLRHLIATLQERHNTRITYTRSIDTDDTAKDGSRFVSRVRGAPRGVSRPLVSELDARRSAPRPRRFCR